MKKLVFTFFFLLITCAFSAQSMEHKKAKQVYIGAIWGGVYGYLEWNSDLEKVLKAKKYSDADIQEMARLTKVENHPIHINSPELFFANKYHFHNFHVMEIASFSSLYVPENKVLKYKLLWIPYEENQNQVDGLKPTDKNGFYIIMHRMSVKSVAETKSNLAVITKEDLEKINAEKARQAALKMQQDAVAAERLDKTYTVTYVLRKVSSNFISSAVYYSAAFVEVYDEKDTRSEERIRQVAETEFKKNISLNGYQIHSVHFDNLPAKDALLVLGALIDLSDTRLYKTELH
jgi:hypothetical protein